MAKKRKETTRHLRIRIEPELLARLEKSRTANNRTLTGEIVHRIEQTYRKSDDADLATLVYRAAFGERTGDLLRAFATAIWLIERRTGKKWNEDRETFFQIWAATTAILNAFALPLTADRAFLMFRQGESPPGDKELQRVRSGEDVALEALQKMGLAPSDAEIDEAAKKYRRLTETKGGQ
jgi:hypothetical protein